jgi:hypothetical protein
MNWRGKRVVELISIPDISEVVYGRQVGYGIREIPARPFGRGNFRDRHS